ncbi:isoaspartyl peptidase/L-asparaginase [Hymenobacter sp. BT186]|uniref:Isoaspartyl peptidase n=1 Tax=Hymenobacter telluris TaxID=2816474 RepID=A0A939JEG3_9BACT|nr:isoaspartyl peptidase/L-asparaginase [Hymenobacter telluris]MBO0359352.1 isoaspartyl peptidase/L-asparaginase [Hymenobacter telluris]MBW3375378.1 isoaspartyl peptidase/L-asparaginase [Hymenobacter norwichensis]
MQKTLLLLFTAVLSHLAPATAQTAPATSPAGPFTLVIHGGAGTITKANMTAEQEKAYQDGLNKALQVGHAILKDGGTALDAVEAAIRVLEDNPLFNAGKGAVFTHEGRNEMDASIMEGEQLRAGAVAGVTVVRNPITAARAVMEKSEHVLLTGPGAEQFAREQGLDIVEPSYFFTQARYDQLQKALSTEKSAGPSNQPNTPIKAAPVPAAPTKAKGKTKAGKPSSALVPAGSQDLADLIFTEGRKYGTVGAVALDKQGNLAAATSTGGMTNKRYGRIGDAPIIGAGTYADNQSCAVSCTGWGEYFIRATVARDVAARMEYQKIPLSQAAQAVIDKVGAMGGNGGLIGLDRAGNITMPFNSEGMYRGFIKEDGRSQVLIYK